MIKLLKPFQSKIQLHIDQGFLQKLWDLYVPGSSEAYDKISLIYLKNGEQSGGQMPQTQVLVNLVLKNIALLKSVEQNRYMFSHSAVANNMKLSVNYYLGQLKRQDVRLFHILDQYAVYVQKEEEENRRYRNWKKENNAIRDMRREYILLRQVFSKIESEMTVHSAQIRREQEKDLFRSMEKKEYRILTERFLWEKRKSLSDYLLTVSEAEYQKILERIRKDDKLRTKLERKSGKVENISRERLIETVEQREDHLMRRFYQKVFSVFYKDGEENGIPAGTEKAESPVDGAVWTLSRENMIHYLERTGDGRISQLWTEVEHLVRQADKEKNDMQSNAQRRIIERVRDRLSAADRNYSVLFKEKLEKQVIARLTPDERKAAGTVVSLIYPEMWREEDSRRADAPAVLNEVMQQEMPGREEIFSRDSQKADRELIYAESRRRDENTLQNDPAAQRSVRQIKDDRLFKMDPLTVIHRTAEQVLAASSAQLEKREKMALEQYRDVLGDALASDVEKKREFSAGEIKAERKALSEETSDKNGDELLTKEESVRLNEWGRALMEHPEEKSGDFVAGKAVDQGKIEIHRLVEEIQKESGTAEPEQIQAEIIRRRAEDLEMREELIRLIHQINEYPDLQKQGRRAEKALVTYQEKLLANPVIRDMLGYLKEAGEEKRRVLIRHLVTGIVSSEQEPVQNRIRHEEDDERLDSWSKMLLVYSGQTDQALSGEKNRQNVEDKHPDLSDTPADIRLQIMRGRDQAELQRLVEQINHYIGRGTESGGEQNEQIPGLVYTDRMLENPEIRNLLTFIRESEDGRKPEMIRRLAEHTEVRRREAQYGIFSAGSERMIHAVKEPILTAEKETIPGADVPAQPESDVRMVYDMRDVPDVTESVNDIRKKVGMESGKEIDYPELVSRIENFERQRRERFDTLTSQISQVVGENTVRAVETAEIPESQQSVPERIYDRPESDIPWEILENRWGDVALRTAAHQNGASTVRGSDPDDFQSLRHKITTEMSVIEEQKKSGEHLREEARQMKSVQAQLEVRLKEVEQQLKNSGQASIAQEDAREIAEQVKKRLHEELHIEKLRRGLL